MDEWIPGKIFQTSYIFGDKQNRQTVKTTNADIYLALTKHIDP